MSWSKAFSRRRSIPGECGSRPFTPQFTVRPRDGPIISGPGRPGRSSLVTSSRADIRTTMVSWFLSASRRESASCALRDEVLPCARDEQEARMPGSTSRIRAVFAALLLGSVVSACGYNAIPTQEEQAKAKWADVQNNYQRRADLIPNLVATVQGYAKQEREVLTSVVEARAKATSVRIDASQ